MMKGINGQSPEMIFNFFIVVQLSSFFPHCSSLSCPHHLFHTQSPPPCCPCPWVFYTCPLTTLSLLSLLSFSPPPLITVSLFFISMSLVLFCSLVCSVVQVPLIGEIIWYLSFTSCLMSLNIVLSSSIHAVVKGRSSFILSAAQYSIV